MHDQEIKELVNKSESGSMVCGCMTMIAMAILFAASGWKFRELEERVVELEKAAQVKAEASK